MTDARGHDRQPTAPELAITVRANGTGSDVRLSASPAERLRDALATIVPQLGERGPAAAKLVAASERRRSWLELDRPVAAAALMSGDTVHVGRFSELADVVAASLPEPGIVELWVHGGPRAGDRFDLPPGHHWVGRDRGSSDVAIVEDPSLSKRHFAVVVGADGVAVADAGSANGTFVDGEPVPPGEPVLVPRGSIIEAGRTSFAWRSTAGREATRLVGGDDGVLVRRPPRVRARWQPPQLQLAAPPEDPRRPRIPIVTSLLPLAVAAVLSVFIGPVMLLIAILSPVVAIASRLEERLGGASEFRRRAETFRADLAEVVARLSDAVADETSARRADGPDAASLVRRISEPAGELWTRRPGDDDFLRLRAGSADQPSVADVAFAAGGNVALRKEAEEEIARLRVARSVPVMVPLGERASLGLVGPADAVDRLGRWLAIQAAVFHAPAALGVRAILSPARLQAWEWLKWLPHSQPTTSHLVVGPEAAHELIDRILPRPDDAKAPYEARPVPGSLWVVDGSLELDASRAARLLEAASAGHIAVIWLSAEERTLPNQIATIARLDPRLARLTLLDVATSSTIDATADGMSLSVATAAARDLAPLVDPMATGLASHLPEKVTLLETTGGEATEAWVTARWASPQPKATLGAMANGTFAVDLSVDGPHALIGGTTGSGKSELLQTLVTGLALGNPPTRVSFLLIDYKGGAAFRECVDLPHVSGLVTDLDDHLARRALVSLDAEIRRRETLLAGLGARSLDAAAERHADDAPPRLVIIVDEFAALVREVPEFVEGVVDIAQRGRTLGIHLVLATQRPAGSVSREVWANTNLRIALRVADPADSLDVIGTPEAAMIPPNRPGRAFARIGQSAPVEFQSAYVGAATSRRSAPVLAARPLTFGGTVPGARRRGAEQADPTAAREVDRTELSAIVEVVKLVAGRSRIVRPPAPWLPQLPDLLSLDGLGPSGSGEGLAPFGLVDDPARQAQEPAILDLARDGAMLIYGGGGSGKSTLLRTIAVALAEGARPDLLHVHAIDFGAGGLQSLEALPHVGSVVPGGDEERVLRLLATLAAQLGERQRLFAQVGVPDLASYRSAAPEETPPPRIVLLLDGYGAFAAAFERTQFGQPLDLIARVATEGRAVGLHLVATADRRGSVPGRLAGVIGRRVVLRASDEAEYAQHGFDRRAYTGLSDTAGRGLTEAGLEIQVAIAGADPDAAGQAASIRAIGDRLRSRAPGVRAPSVNILASDIPAGELPAPRVPGTAMVGRADRDLEPIGIDLADAHFLIAGPLRSGKSTALGTIASSLKVGGPDIELHLLAPRRTPLTALEIWTSVSEGLEACDARIEALAAATQPPSRVHTVLVIDDGDELFESASAGTLASLARRGRDAGLRVLAAAELRSALRAFGGWLAELRKDRHGLLLQPGQEMAGELLASVLPRVGQSAKPMPPGRGYLVVRGEVDLIQAAR